MPTTLPTKKYKVALDKFKITAFPKPDVDPAGLKPGDPDLLLERVNPGGALFFDHWVVEAHSPEEAGGIFKKLMGITATAKSLQICDAERGDPSLVEVAQPSYEDLLARVRELEAEKKPKTRSKSLAKARAAKAAKKAAAEAPTAPETKPKTRS